jgi:hypothetical protein
VEWAIVAAIVSSALSVRITGPGNSKIMKPMVISVSTARMGDTMDELTFDDLENRYQYFCTYRASIVDPLNGYVKEFSI